MASTGPKPGKKLPQPASEAVGEQQQMIEWMPSPGEVPSGMASLDAIDRVIIRPDFDSMQENENAGLRFNVKNADNQQVFTAICDKVTLKTEHRRLRQFDFRLIDLTMKEAVRFSSPAMTSWCGCCCCASGLHHVNVSSPPTVCIGYVHERCAPFGVTLELVDAEDHSLGKLEGGRGQGEFRLNVPGSTEYAQVNFGGEKKIGQLEEELLFYTIRFSQKIEPKTKMLLIAATLLLDCLFVEMLTRKKGEVIEKEKDKK